MLSKKSEIIFDVMTILYNIINWLSIRIRTCSKLFIWININCQWLLAIQFISHFYSYRILPILVLFPATIFLMLNSPWTLILQIIFFFLNCSMSISLAFSLFLFSLRIILLLLISAAIETNLNQHLVRISRDMRARLDGQAYVMGSRY